jgi:hypothetical protein
MRSRGLSFADAVKVAGGGVAGLAAGTAGAIDFFALRDQLVTWGQTAAG